MALVQCPECQKEVSSNAAECPHCGYNPSVVAAVEEARKQEKWDVGCGIIMILFIVLIFVSFAQ